MKHSAWLLYRFQFSATGRTPREIIAGAPDRGELVPFDKKVTDSRPLDFFLGKQNPVCG